MNIQFNALLKKELISIWNNKKSKSVIILPPILQLFIFSHAATLDITNIKIGILDKDNTEISREFVRQIYSSRFFSKTYFLKNENEMKNFIDEEKINSCVYINNDFTKRYKSKNYPNIFIISDGRRTNSSEIISGYITNIALNFNGIKKEFFKPKIETIVKNNFNPNLSYHLFIISCLMGILPMTVVILLSALSLAREKEEGTFDELLILPIKPHYIVFSKIMVPVFFGIINGIIVLILAMVFFKLKFSGSFLLYVVSLMVFLWAISGVGLYISTISKTQGQAMLLVFTFMFPAIMLSGYTSPIENITPKALQYLTIFNPLRFFLVISKGIILKNMNFYYVCCNLLPLLIISFLTGIGANKAFRGSMK